MTVREYLLFAAELKKVPKKKRREHVAEIIEKIQIGDVENRLIKNLSKGYRQRVGLAQALIGYPDVIILDEPMVGLDPKQIIEMRDLIKSLAVEHTVILSSHILSEVSAVCDHIMIISAGKLVASGSPEQLQEMMQVKVELDITVLGEEEQAENVLQEMPEVESYTFEEAGEAGSIKIHVVSKDNADIRKELSVALSGAGMPILSMNRIEKSLEDIFLELTDEHTEADVESESAEEAEKEETEHDSDL
jgi:ABC-2 type transport system ATP-binding protein